MRVEKTYKVVYNNNWGGFDLYEKAKEWLKERGFDCNEFDFYYDHRLRSHPLLVECVETLGEAAGRDLAIAEVPVGEGYYISEYDGNEQVITKDDFIYPWTENDVTLNTTEVTLIANRLHRYKVMRIQLGELKDEIADRLIERLEGRDEINQKRYE